MADTYRILVTGSREFDDWDTMRAELGGELARIMATAKGPYPEIVVVHGGARGADAMAELAARDYGLRTERHPADWNTHGRSAGYRRNAAMVALGADLCLAFYKQDAGNRGTGHCARLAERAGIPVRRVTGS